jgi:hypothetical protein
MSLDEVVLEELQRFIHATESFFHPSNSGKWTTSLVKFVFFLSYEFLQRWNDGMIFAALLFLPPGEKGWLTEMVSCFWIPRRKVAQLSNAVQVSSYPRDSIQVRGDPSPGCVCFSLRKGDARRAERCGHVAKPFMDRAVVDHPRNPGARVSFPRGAN